MPTLMTRDFSAVRYCYEASPFWSESYQTIRLIGELFSESFGAESPYDVRFISHRGAKTLCINSPQRHSRDVERTNLRIYSAILTRSLAYGAPMPGELINTHKQFSNSRFVVIYFYLSALTRDREAVWRMGKFINLIRNALYSGDRWFESNTFNVSVYQLSK